MKVFILLCVTTLALASKGDDCPENSSYNSCGTMCPLTCDNYNDPPKACVLMCNPGCHCDEGYVKTKDGRCVEPENCPQGADAVVFHAGGVCDQPAISGGCNRFIPKWYFDKRAKECKRFVYSGCGGNDNSFRDKKDCEKRCLQDDNDEINVDLCEQIAKSGGCSGFFPMWYFDRRTKECKRFVYSGCGGNDNSFRDKEDCEKRCMQKA